MSEYSDAQRETVGDLLSRNMVWRIPVYQRHYAWENSKTESGPIDLFWETVEKQTCARLRGETPPPHYLGSVLVDEKTEKKAPGSYECDMVDVVDGQQRLTTIQIALLALLRAMEKNAWGDRSWRMGIKKELDKYVFSKKAEKEVENETRLRPTNFDKHQFETIMFLSYGYLSDVNKEGENDKKSKVGLTYTFFRDKYVELVNESSSRPQETVEAIMKTLTEGFDVVLIILREEDEAQQIFESLNNFSKPLTTFDLIRNNVFYRAAKIKKGEDEKLFKREEWQDLEDSYWEEKADGSKSGGSTHIEAYVARMLVAKMQKEIKFNLNSIFKNYKEFSKKYSSIDEEIKSLVDYVDIYRSLDLEKKESYYGVFYYSIWQNRDFYPAIFSIERSNASAAEKQRMLRLLESYVIRRNICGLPRDHYNLYAVSICGKLGDTPTYTAMHDMFKNAEGASNVFPVDKDVIRGCVDTNFYKNKPSFRQYMFKKIEKSMNKDNVETIVVPDGSLTIDHILPKKWSANEEWKRILLSDCSPNEKEIKEGEIEKLMNTIGNLTMMSGANNSKKSNNSFDDFKWMLRNSSMTMNRDLAELIDEKGWDIETIRERSKELADIICKLWPYDIE